MTMPSNVSGNPSGKAGEGSSLLRLKTLNARLMAQRNAEVADNAQRIGESIPSLIGPSPTYDLLTLVDKSNAPRRHCKRIDESESPPAWLLERDKLCALIGSGCMVALIGNRGTGKTQMAVHAMLYTAYGQRLPWYVKATEIFLTIRATYNKPDQCELDALQQYIKPGLLVIDEIQQRGETAFEDRLLAYLIDKRYDAMSDTILIGNLTPKALAESLDASIVDRLRETGGIIECVWESFRGKSND